MDWIQFSMLLLGMIGMFLGLSKKLDEFKDSVQKEMKDFHGRLCKLEEKYQQLIERFWDRR